RPPVLAVGAGASRGAPAAEVIALVQQALADANLAEKSVGVVATIDQKRNEPGILQLAAHLKVSLQYFAADELAVAPGAWTRSAIVRAAVGTGGVCEPAALLAARSDTLIVAKRKSAHATAAIARCAEGL
ncbi:MAG: cobalamin biosynthesis protein, partial [Dehalococcoidia bacterium]